MHRDSGGRLAIALVMLAIATAQARGASDEALKGRIDAGFSAYMVRLPDDDLSVIVLSNLGTGNAADRARRVLRVLLD